MNSTIKTTPKDFFLHLGATVALYLAAISLINLLFSIINYFFPDSLAGYFFANSVAWPISMLVILVPVLYGLEYLIRRDIAKVPEKANLWIRKWRIYLTIFLMISLIGGDLIALINTYLNGEISSRFVFKVVAILLIGGSIGKYYFFSLYTNFKFSKISRTANAWFGLTLVIAAIIIGFIVVGSPAKQRAIRFDNQRTSDLQNIQWQIVNYWQQKEKLPATLADLNDPLYGTVVPVDPETKAAYEYSVKENLSFELCSVFSLAYEDTQGRGEYGYGQGSYAIDMSYPSIPGGIDNNWKHEAGKSCFTRTIDPEKYPKFPKAI
jgi:hypothetical protein